MQTFVILRRAFFLIVFICGLAGAGHTLFAQDSRGEVLILTVHGEIDSVTQRYITRGIDRAEKQHAELVVIQLNTPGGLLSSTQEIVQLLLNTGVPTAVYVTPPGAFAASAGTFITAAANFAVMAETSSIGAASPVGGGGAELPETSSAKAKNITAAMIQGIAEKRGRNVEKLMSTVTEAKAFSAREAVSEGVVDFIASDLNDLLAKVNGKTVQTAGGTRTLNTASLSKQSLNMNFSERFISFIANPNVIVILLTIGGLGIFAELLHPGVVAPGVVGIICLLLGFVALGFVPFNWAGAGLLALAAILIFFEMQAPGLGFLGIAGVIAFILGALLLFPTDLPALPGAPKLQVSRWLIGILAAMLAAFTLLIVTAVVKSRRLTYPSGSASLVGKIGRVTSDLDPTGTVQISSELWSATSEDESMVRQGEKVQVMAVEGLTLRVRKL